MSTGQLLNLTVETGDEAAEIFIIDGQFNRIKSGTGKQAIFQLSKGLYAVKVKAGCESQEKTIELFEDETVSFTPIKFTTAAPLEGTAKTHEFQIEKAVTHSNEVHQKLGNGSQIYVFARKWTEKDRSTNVSLNKDPATGLTLRNTKDEILVDFGSPDVGIYSYDWEPWSACNVELDPGVYSLCLETHSKRMYKQTIIASPGWQTQIFLLQRNYGIKEVDYRADLSDASILMGRIGEGFKSLKKDDVGIEPDFRLAELARQALINDRRRLSQNLLQQALHEKFSNPMLGLYGAHLLLRNKNYDNSLLETVINNLRNCLQEPHPDVEVLALKSGLGSDYIFDTPPMLRSSWGYVLEASVHQPHLVPENSVASGIAGNLWSEGIWLIWGSADQQTDNDQMLMEQLKKLSQLEASSVDTSNLATDQLMAVNNDMPFDAGNPDIMAMPQAPAFIDEPNANQPGMTDEQLTHLVQALGVPRAKLDVMLKNIGTDK